MAQLIRQLDMELFGGCNYKCVMCPQGTEQGREKEFKKSLTWKNFIKIVEDHSKIKDLKILREDNMKKTDKFIKYEPSKINSILGTNIEEIDFDKYLNNISETKLCPDKGGGIGAINKISFALTFNASNTYL